MIRIGARAALLAGLLAAAAAPASAQWSQVYEQFYLPADHNWEFRDKYMAADRLFNAFDYGHAILYETLYTEPDAPVSRLEEEVYGHLTGTVLREPPHVPLEEGAIEIAYAKLAPEAKIMFDWAHILHRQIYDILADESLTEEAKDDAVAEVLAYYRSRPDIAFSSRPKSMELMDGQHYSLAFRQKYPKFNGLIWGYHWLQIGLYEPLLLGDDLAERQALVDAAVARFWQMVEDAPDNMPYLMPMTAAVAPTFSARYPEAAIIFDNLHMMHDVVSDILASDRVPRDRKREELMRAARLFRDDTSYVTTVDEWRRMAAAMGLNNMGGPAVGFLGPLPRPTVARGASMAGMEHGASGHEAHAAEPQAADTAHAGHQAPPAAPQGPDTAHAAHRAPPAAGREAPAGMEHAMHAMMADTAHMRLMHELMMRMMADPVIRQRIMADTAMHRMMMQMMEQMPAAQRERMMRTMHPEGTPQRRPPAPQRPAPPKPAPKKPTEHQHPPPDRR